MKISSRAIRILVTLVAGIALSPTTAAVIPSAAAAAATPRDCAPARLVAFVDPARGSSMEPHVDVHWSDLATPAQARINWGNGEYQIARVDSLQSAARPVAVDARYTMAGDYMLTVSVTDACGTTQVDTLQLTVPLSTAQPPGIECPGTLDPSGFCLVAQGEPVAVQIAGALPGSTPLTWRSDRPLAGIDPTLSAASVGLTLPDATAYTLQASARTPDGWVVTKPLTLIGVPRRPEAITVFAAPHTAVAGEPLSLNFEPPGAPVAGVAHISLDGDTPLDGSSASVTLSAGSHTITYSVAYPDGSSVQRQTIVVGRAAPVPPAAIFAGIAAAVGALGALLLIGRRLRKGPARPSGTPAVMPTLPRHRPAPPVVSATRNVAASIPAPGLAVATPGAGVATPGAAGDLSPAAAGVSPAAAAVAPAAERPSTSWRWPAMRTLRAPTVTVVVLVVLAVVIEQWSNS
jgi:hypothetical protein